MNKVKKILLIVGSSLLALGMLISLISAIAVGFDRESLDLDVLKESSYSYNEEIKSITITSDASDILINSSNEVSEAKLEIAESSKHFHNVSLDNGVLNIEIKNKSGFLGSGTSLKIAREINLILPQKSYKNLKIKSVSGKVEIESIALENLNVDLVSGSLTINNATIDNADIKSVSGNINSNNVTFSTYLNLNTVSGNFKGVNIQSNLIKIEATSGNISLSLKKNMAYALTTISGNIIKPSGDNESGKCNIKTVSGDITIRLI